jgi:nucleoside-diphosphate-sugar epimerase
MNSSSDLYGVLLMEIDVKSRDKTVLVFGATGQQGGSVANALRSNGWGVKALVRNPNSDKASLEQGGMQGEILLEFKE